MARLPLSRVENFDRHTQRLDASSRKISFYGEQRPPRGLLPPLYRYPPCASIVKYRGPLAGSRKYEQKVERTVWLSRARLLRCVYIYICVYSFPITRSLYDRFTRLHRERCIRIRGTLSYRESTGPTRNSHSSVFCFYRDGLMEMLVYREMKSTRIGDTSDVSIDIIHLETIFQTIYEKLFWIEMMAKLI